MKKLLLSKKFGLTVFYSVIYSLALSLFMNNAGLLATGLTGIVQIINEFFIESIDFGVLYLLFNIPVLVIGYFFIGKKFTFYTIVSVLTVSLTSSLLPSFVLSDDIFLNSIFGGLIMGYAIGGLLKIGSSSGGTDILGIIYYQKKGTSFTKFNSILNLFIIVIGALLYGGEVALYTLVSMYFRNQGINTIFTNNEKITVWIIGKDLSSVSLYINSKLSHGTTIFPECRGGFSGNRKDVLMTILNKYEYGILINDISKIAPDAFINVTETFKIEGNYKHTKGD